MKKKIFGGIVAIVIAAIAAMNVNFNFKTENGLSTLNFMDIEALAQNENGGGGGLGCYTQTVSACWSVGGFSPGDQHVCIFNNVDAAPYRCGEISCYGNASYRTCVGGNSPYN